MNIIGHSFTLCGHRGTCFLLKNKADLTAAVTDELRASVQACTEQDYPAIYLDTRAVESVDLSGVNEIIHAHYTLRQARKKLVLVYRKNSPVAKWVATTGLDRFIETAIVA
jgi:anti-anti-sigma factor